MLAELLIALQAGPVIAMAEPPPIIDLIAPVRALRCPEARGEEIVVCGQRPGEEDRLFVRREPWTDRPLPRASYRLFRDVDVAAEAEAATLPGGVQSTRGMIRLKTPF
jgi:hypothetical protein